MSGILVSKTASATIGTIGPQEVIITADDDSIKIGDGNGNFVGITGDALKVTGTFIATNPSVSENVQPVPEYSTQVGAEDPNGDLQSLKVNTLGELKVAGLAAFDTQDVKVLFNLIGPIAIGVETLINTYTAPVGKISYLLSIRASGENRGTYNVYLNSVLLDQDYTNVTDLKALFDYKTGANSVPGMIIPVGDIVDIKAINNGTSTANYSARFLVLEVT